MFLPTLGIIFSVARFHQPNHDLNRASRLRAAGVGVALRTVGERPIDQVPIS